MRVKKKDLRNRDAQLPINFPDPVVENEFCYEEEAHKVENLCKRLAHNEVEIRDAVLAELPRYIREVTERYLVAEANKRDEEAAGAGAGQFKKRRRREQEEAAATVGGIALNSDLELVLRKLCLGIFYCFWHSDKPLVQHECAFKISQLLFAPITFEARNLFLGCFMEVFDKEWRKIDHYRLDKYLALIRKVVFQSFRHIADCAQLEDKARATALVKGLVGVYQDKLVHGDAVGLLMHVCDVCFDEMIRANLVNTLFLQLSRGIPLYAMSRGNFVEKRVLDNFLLPFSVGMVDAKRIDMPKKLPESETDNDLLADGMAKACKVYSVAKGTTYASRVMFAEAQKMISDAVDVKREPANYKPIRGKALRERIAREVEETNRNRVKIVKEKKQDRKDKIQSKTKVKRKFAKENPEESATLEKERKAKKVERAAKKMTKRKREYQLTAADFNDDADSE